MSLTYYGSMSSAAGEICYIENLPLNDLLNGGAGAVPLSVDGLFRSTTKHQRLTTDTHEVVYRPNGAHGDTFFNQTPAPITYYSGAPTQTSDVATMHGMKVFGFAWRNAPSGISHTHTLTKVAEWRPETHSGLPRISPTTIGPSIVPHAIATLDKHVPGWTSRVVDKGGSTAAAIARTAFTGAPLASAANLASGGFNGIKDIIHGDFGSAVNDLFSTKMLGSAANIGKLVSFL